MYTKRYRQVNKTSPPTNFKGTKSEQREHQREEWKLPHISHSPPSSHQSPPLESPSFHIFLLHLIPKWSLLSSGNTKPLNRLRYLSFLNADAVSQERFGACVYAHVYLCFRPALAKTLRSTYISTFWAQLILMLVLHLIVAHKKIKC